MNNGIMGEHPGITTDAIASYVEKYDFVSFAELTLHFGTKAEGEVALVLQQNILLWGGMSDVFANALAECFAKETIHPHASQVLIYAIDGRVPNLPVVVRAPKKGYKEQHWLPIVFRLGAKCTHPDCPERKIKLSGAELEVKPND